MAHSSIHVNSGAVTSVDVFMNSPESPDLIVCDVVESEQFYRGNATFYADRSIWQQIVNQLGALGITARPCSCGSRETYALTPGETVVHRPDGCTIEKTGAAQ